MMGAQTFRHQLKVDQDMTCSCLGSQECFISFSCQAFYSILMSSGSLTQEALLFKKHIPVGYNAPLEAQILCVNDSQSCSIC